MCVSVRVCVLQDLAIPAPYRTHCRFILNIERKNEIPFETTVFVPRVHGLSSALNKKGVRRL